MSGRNQKMSKEKKQKIILGGMIGLFVLVGVYQFTVVPLLHGIEDLEAKREKLEGDLVKAEKLIKGRTSTMNDALAIRAELDRIFVEEMPPSDNALAWAQQAVYAQTRAMKLQVLSLVEEQNIGGVWDGVDLLKKTFKPYGIRLELVASFEEIRNLVRALQSKSPRLSVTAIGISADGKSPEKHQLSLTLEWPSWRDATLAMKPFDGK